MDILCMNERLDKKRVPAKVIYFLYEDGKIPAHWHMNVEINCVIHGEMSMLVDGKRTLFSDGECVIVNSNCVHIARSVSENRAEGICLVFSYEYMRELCPDLDNIRFDWNSCPEKQAELYGLIEEIYYIYKKRFDQGKPADIDDGSSYDFLLVKSFIDRILYLLFSDFRAKEEETVHPRLQRQNKRIQTSVAFIEKHYSETLSVEDMAELTGVSREYFSRSFKQYTGITFSQYLNTVRLMIAFRQLVSTDLPVLDIAMSSGFPDLRAFVRCFKNVYHCSPTEYRKKNKPEKISQIVL